MTLLSRGLRQGAQELMRKSARRAGIAKLYTANLRTEISRSSKTLYQIHLQSTKDILLPFYRDFMIIIYMIKSVI